MKTVLIVAFLCACGGDSAFATDMGSRVPLDETFDVAGDVTDELQGGARDSRDPAVGYLELDGNQMCTGVLIAPDVVLTAGHCAEVRVIAFRAGDARRGFIGRRVVGQITHPGYLRSARCPNPTYDLALLRLAAPVSDIAPLPLAINSPTPGQRCRAVGFGRHTNVRGITTAGDKRVATEEVIGSGRTWIQVAWGTGIVDHGDSGGPLLCAGRVAAITSCGDDPSPDRVTAYHARVDGARDWIVRAIGY